MFINVLISLQLTIKVECIPAVTLEAITVFLSLHQQRWDAKAEELYNDRFLEIIRFATKDDTFVSAHVRAEMKQIIYHVDVRINNGGSILETQCDCGVGMGLGARCKHVRVTMFAVTRQKEGIKLYETCTQQLQTFHKAKPFKGSPIKMEHQKLQKASFSTEATSYGIVHEAEARKHFEVLSGLKVSVSGIRIHPQFPFLGCSPYDMVGQEDLLEIKCPFKAKNQVLTSDNVLCLTLDDKEELHLNQTHDYYYQIQGQLLCTQRQRCHFFVWSSKSHHLEGIRWEGMTPSLITLHDTATAYTTAKKATLRSGYAPCARRSWRPAANLSVTNSRRRSLITPPKLPVHI
ncbi:hypothetical protein CAPTEDRAFT_208191 [Capitella teleta]|uniref:SWIM-type domain-containing protein n=1 Tax=Capitella teleta TaxID=283909 RepID=R7T604_CAPTE|nr:hypothetical protein CAPTEDRAFT_208191 [Capitella teleta]|eukprot:ELT88760.1 hypothetical protein CAPTEDRAFT_208191 [Capitella teleta]